MSVFRCLRCYSWFESREHQLYCDYCIGIHKKHGIKTPGKNAKKRVLKLSRYRKAVEPKVSTVVKAHNSPAIYYSLDFDYGIALRDIKKDEYAVVEFVDEQTILKVKARRKKK